MQVISERTLIYACLQPPSPFDSTKLPPVAMRADFGQSDFLITHKKIRANYMPMKRIKATKGNWEKCDIFEKKIKAKV